MSASNEEIREYAQKRAQECIDDWANEGMGEHNDLWDTDFTDEELRQIMRLAATAMAVLPDTTEGA